MKKLIIIFALIVASISTFSQVWKVEYFTIEKPSIGWSDWISTSTTIEFRQESKMIIIQHENILSYFQILRVGEKYVTGKYQCIDMMCGDLDGRIHTISIYENIATKFQMVQVDDYSGYKLRYKLN